MSKTLTIEIATPEEMSALGTRIADVVSSGTTLLLSGPIGAGKTHLARAIIQALLDEPEEVPSPTYTLVQTYQSACDEIWHADLYRLSDATEFVEIGLDDAIGDAIVLIEWPDRLPSQLTPKSAQKIEISLDGQSRRVRLCGNQIVSAMRMRADHDD